MAEEALRPLSDVPAINRFLSYCRVRTIPGKTVMIHAGDLPDVLYYIVDGSVEVTRKGKELRTLESGDFIGEIALVADVPRTATVTSSSPVRLLVITDRAFKSLLERTPSMATKVLQSLGERLHSDAL